MVWVRIFLILCVLSLPLHNPEPVKQPQLAVKHSMHHSLVGH